MNNDLISREQTKDFFHDEQEYFGYVIKKTLDIVPTAKQTQGEWVPVSEKLPEEKTNPYTLDFEYVLCSTIWDDVRPYKYGKPKGHDKSHFWYGGRIMDEAVIAWQPLPEPYKEDGAE